MALAKITLVGSITHTSSTGRKLEQNKTQFITGASEIRYYQGIKSVLVEIVEDSKKEKKLKEKKEEKTEEKKKKRYSQKKLKSKERTQLFKIAEKIDVLITGSETKAELVELILQKQQEEENENENEEMEE